MCEGGVTVSDCLRLYLGLMMMMEDYGNDRIYLLLCSATYVSGSEI